jgi:phosphonate transport system substrate-binding protein
MFPTLRICFAVLLLAVTTGAAAQTAHPAVLATYAYTRYDRAAALAPLAAHLQQTLGKPVAVRVLDSPRALAAALRDGSVDIAVTNTFVYLAVRDDTRLRALAAFDVPAATLDTYRGVLLARAGTVTGIADLHTATPPLRYAQVIPGSTSGGLVQDLHLAAHGIDSKAFASIRHAGTHDAALTALQDDTADIAALADAPWQAEKAKGNAAGIVELWRSPPIPPGPVVCRAGERIDCAKAAQAIDALHEQAPEALAALVAAWSEAKGAARMRKVDSAAYDALLEGPADSGALKRVLEQSL